MAFYERINFICLKLFKAGDNIRPVFFVYANARSAAAASILFNTLYIRSLN